MGLHDHLLAREQAVCDEFAGSQGDLSVSHDCDRVRKIEVVCRSGLQTAVGEVAESSKILLACDRS